MIHYSELLGTDKSKEIRFYLQCPGSSRYSILENALALVRDIISKCPPMR